MRVFLVSLVAVVVLGLGALLSLSAVQEHTGVSYSTSGARISPAWSVRQVFSQPTAPSTAATTPMSEGMVDEQCDVGAWAMIRADFRNSPTAEPTCKH